jgi:hypothetical protein
LEHRRAQVKSRNLPTPNPSLNGTSSCQRGGSALEGWKVFEAPGVEPVFPEKAQAINYAQNRASFCSGKIRILDSTGNIELTIPFTEADRKL